MMNLFMLDLCIGKSQLEIAEIVLNHIKNKYGDVLLVEMKINSNNIVEYHCDVINKLMLANVYETIYSGTPIYFKFQIHNSSFPFYHLAWEKFRTNEEEKLRNNEK